MPWNSAPDNIDSYSHLQLRLDAKRLFVATPWLVAAHFNIYGLPAPCPRQGLWSPLPFGFAGFFQALC
nr:uncharacterized protein [uncultured bacterium]